MDVNHVLAGALGAMAMVILYFILPKARRPQGSPGLTEAVTRANDDALKLLEHAKREADAAAERARRETSDLTRQAEEIRRQAEDARREAEAAKREAQLEAKAAALRASELAKEESARMAAELDKLNSAREERIGKREQLAHEREELLQQKEVDLARREAALRVKEQGIVELRAEAARLAGEQRTKLEAIAGVSGEQVRRELMEEFFDEARRAAARESKAIEDAAREEAEKRARRLLGIAIQRYASDEVQERAVVPIHLPNDEMKGRIIGREGRNIRALQEACGVDFIVDDTPETIVVSGFDPLRREVARVALERLIQDGRIHPSRIEEVVSKAREEVDRSAGEAGEQALVELGITGVHPELIKLLGRLRYHYSYAQNVLRHSVETGFLCGLMSAELGQDEKLARRAGLLHDIGKAIGHEQEGSHAVVGAQYARKFGEDPIVANAIGCHHDDEPPQSIIGNLVMAADALSGSRPGARRETLEGYVKRLKDLEEISRRFAGVERSFAIQAGRELRVMVEPTEVSDAEAALLAREITKRIEQELSYPGQIRVTVVRETRAVDYAK